MFIDSCESSVVAVARQVARIIAQCNIPGLAVLQRMIAFEAQWRTQTNIAAGVPVYWDVCDR